jgi:hypothetical protein
MGGALGVRFWALGNWSGGEPRDQGEKGSRQAMV